MRFATALCLLLMSSGVLADATEHPFAKQTAPVGLDLSFGRLEWGKTTLGYSQSWIGSGSISQGYLLKDLRAPLADGLELNARFGFSFVPGTGLNGASNEAELVIPYAALHWQPSESFQLRLEYSRPGQGAFHPYGLRSYPEPWYARDETESPYRP